jgi:hypothetical protein
MIACIKDAILSKTIAGAPEKGKKCTALGLPVWSPTTVLPEPDDA